ncbi:similar to Saccharomyces cerevisiae YHR101C BIG1 Integral membrane protein of the endoplasmic reticulum, required for normal content of cell wall beta- 1,6-glucan [Maudiozyma barnettii]|uniref:Protein BIG1 n=1 Tax=Maudiozyma barnettii TaxID=61262 RepID=A0A8H2ZF65_9SACH|nr:Big1p [Kazachstania barnettii]CAB4252019.1 similar to Saccharomyces cerevisiae YHR101C BIG1 Integral membrane protein of the endoplasmic reticulum, required for normal content of cell wall beta- 1,6-glucan [Kazachstania barnettii]CAD1778455.1 similar to Saccharomyces cerevisiae YHR101C BIG1 Integral membrane protein of the endoplasmic reticulum, required for normal content of cell wall beta- 1,6-glucan [Kazachstania barnettii]
MLFVGLLSFLLVLLPITAGANDNLVVQKSVPVLLFSHKVSPGLLKYQKNYDPKTTVPIESFEIISHELIDHCNSDTYIYVNIPGLRKLDLIEYEDELKFLQRYLNQSSTKLKFEQVKNLPEDYYSDLTTYTKDTCKFEGYISLHGNNSDDFTTYLDSGKRIIEINYSPLPDDDVARLQSIIDFDLYFREILAQLPSPDQTIILTSLHPSLVPERDYKSMPIFPKLFEDLNEVEKNNMILDVAPLTNKFSPKFSGMEDVPPNVFDIQFYNENKIFILTIIIVFVTFEILSVSKLFGKSKHSSQKPNPKKDLKIEEKREIYSLETEKEGRTVLTKVNKGKTISKDD